MIKNKKLYIIVLTALLSICTLMLAACGSYTLRYLSEEGGTIKGSATQEVNGGSDGETVTAVPNDGYEFTGWSDGVKTASRQDKNVNDNLTVTAKFKKLEQPKPPVPEHKCENACETCGRCKNLDCKEEACKVKCECKPEPPTHKCENACDDCGKCTNENCKEQACLIKCKCGEQPVPEHKCENACEICERCKNLDCKEEACKVKCECKPEPPEHKCESKCKECGQCTDESCNEEACLPKCECGKVEPHTHKYTATVTNPTCTEDGFAAYECECGESYAENIPATGHTPQEPIIADRVPATCTAQGSYTEIIRCKDCNALISSEPKTLPIIPHEYVNGLCVNCNAIDPNPKHVCENVCETCGHCTNEVCNEKECLPKCSCAENDQTYTVTYLLNNEEWGHFMGEATQTVRHGKSTTPVTAMPYEGYRFVRWSDNDSTISTRQEDNVTCDITVTAILAIQTHTIIYSTDGHGTINGFEQQTIPYGGDGTPVTAIPDEGYEFIKWSDERLSPERQDFDVRYDLMFTALFRELEKPEIEHKCKSVCPLCGGCKNNACVKEVCENKCFCVVTPPPHDCESKCPSCYFCLNPDCTDSTCAQKCTCTTTPIEKTYTITYVTGEGGTISGDAIQTVKEGEDGTMVSVTPNVGYQFWYWSDRPSQIGMTYAQRNETNVISDLTITAVFMPCSYRYSAQNGGGVIYHNGEPVEPMLDLFMNDDGTFDEVTAVAYEGFRFIGWSDGVLSETRRESVAISGYKNIYAIFQKLHLVTYKVYNDIGGQITGSAEQFVATGLSGEPVRATANAGYIFVGWSDNAQNNEHIAIQVDKSLEFVAFFELIEKTFEYNYNGANQPLQTSITLNRDNLTNVTFTVPQRAGYTFDGWYAEPEFKTKVADENGKYYLGLLPFSMTETQIFAKWIKDGEEPELPVYKILVVANDEFNSVLWSSNINAYMPALYKMTTIQRQTVKTVVNGFAEMLNNWLDGAATFEVDLYFTTDVWTLNFDANQQNGAPDVAYDSLFAQDVPEVAEIYQNYNARFLIYGYALTDDFINTDGALALNDANIVTINHLESDYATLKYYLTSDEEKMLRERPLMLDVMLTRFCKIVQSQAQNAYPFVSEFEDYANDGTANKLPYVKAYLCDEVSEYNPECNGIPADFWQNL